MLTYMTQKKHDPKLGKKQINFRLRNLHRIGLEMASRQHGTDLTEEIHTAIRTKKPGVVSPGGRGCAGWW